MASFIDGPAEMRAVLEVFKTEIESGAIRPLRDRDDEVISIGLDEHSTFFVRMEKHTRSGTIEVQLCRAEGSVVVECWDDWELGGRVVEELWTACRNRLYSSEFEDGVASLTNWLRRHRVV